MHLHDAPGGRLLAQAERAQVAARLALRGETGTIRIGMAGAAVFGGVVTSWIAPAVAAFLTTGLRT